MQAILRLQNHGCKNHPYWWIVAAPRKSNLKGRIIEHVGYWIPCQRKTVQRSIILNKPRLRYWLAMGAKATPKVHRFLSYIDLLPPPLIKYGSRNLYDKPKKVVTQNTFKPKNPLEGVFQRTFMDRIMDQEDKNMIKRQLLSENVALPPTSNELTEQWDKLRAELYQMEKTNKHNPFQREQLFKKMNDIANKWQKESEIDKIRALKTSVQGTKVTEKNLKQQMQLQDFIEKHERQIEEKTQWIEGIYKLQLEFKPLTRDQVYEYLEEYQDGNDSLIMEQVEAIYIHAMESDQVVSKALVDDYIRNEMDNSEMIDEVNHLDIKDYSTTEIEFMPVNKPVHPLPNLDEYNPDDYTDIHKQQEQLIKNKDFSIPNVDLEGTSDTYPINYTFNMRMRNASRGRAANERKTYFSPLNKKKK